jgi:hypothetical protein
VECSRCGRFEIEHALLEHFRTAYEDGDRNVVETFPRLSELVRRVGGLPVLSWGNWRALAAGER